MGLGIAPRARRAMCGLICVGLWLTSVQGARAAGPAELMAEQTHGIDRHYGKTCTTAGCHATPAEPGVPRHVPFLEGACLTCHDDHSTSSPGLLKPGGNQVCLQCHTGIELAAGTSDAVHPAAPTRCLDCHEPHQGRIRSLLRSEEQLGLCASCHGEFLAQSAQLPHHHQFFEPRTQCGNCHAAHSNREHSYLRSEVTDTCLTCHDLPIQTDSHRLENVAQEVRNAKFVHAAITEKGCPSCHTPHGSVQPSLLKAGYPSGRYAPYQTSDYALCWTCHNPELAESTTSTQATAFRDGSRNLHHVHVVQLKRGRACHLCHEAHAAERPHLLRPSTRFGSWEGQLNWTATPTGGSCSTPCHKEQTYDRSAR